MTERFDVVIVGGRCAGATLAHQLARKGLSVCVVDRSRFPSEVPSTHVIQPNGVATLERMGLLERIVAAGAPTPELVRVFLDDVTVDYGKDYDLVGRVGSPLLSARRVTLDKLLLDAASEAGADVRTETAVTALAEEDGSVTGVQTANGEIKAALVVGADGPNSTVGRLVGAKEYATTPPGRAFFWGYFEGAVDDGDRLRLGKMGDTAMLAAPTDGDLYLTAIVPSMSEKDRFIADLGGGLTEGIAKFSELREVLADARRVGPVRVMGRWHGFLRESAGPGWVLVGDAGHFKDPTPGQGIADAFRQVEKLAPAIEVGLQDGRLDQRLAAWARWRDEDAWEMYWFATDLGAPGLTPPLVREVLRDLTSTVAGKTEFVKLMNHDLLPSRVFTPSRAVRSFGRLAYRHPGQIRSLTGDLFKVVSDDISRKRLRRAHTATAA